MTVQTSSELIKERRKRVLISASLLVSTILGIYVSSLFLLGAGGMH